MDTAYDFSTTDSDFRPQATMWIALGSLVLVGPFAAFHSLHQRPGLGAIALGVVLVLGFNAWYLRREESLRSLGPRLVIAAAGIVLDLYLLATQGMNGLLWGYPTVLWLYSTLPERAARGANGVLLAGSLPLISAVAPPEVASRAIATLAGVSLFSCVLVHVISRQQERLERQIRHDPLTGLLNRHALDDIIGRAIARTSRDRMPMVLLAIDLDHFKRINDDFGHAAGDEVLRALGALLLNRLRASDVAFRIGGEEFLVLLHDTAEGPARRVAEALLTEIRETPLLEGRMITASIGLAPFGGERDALTWIANADESLYRAKRAGRDRVVHCPGPESRPARLPLPRLVTSDRPPSQSGVSARSSSPRRAIGEEDRGPLSHTS